MDGVKLKTFVRRVGEALAAVPPLWLAGAVIYRLWTFYRQGLTGLERAIAGIPPGDTVERLLAARPYFQLYAHSTVAPERILAPHCPMCHVELVDHPTMGLHCPQCSAGIEYVQRTTSRFTDPAEPVVTRGPSFIWLPRRVGEYLKKRYERIWR